jgi:hypothetical protein
MTNAPRTALAVLLFGAACVSNVGSALAQTTPAPSVPAAMPPGMTPETMRMMMTPGEMNPKGLPAGLTPQSGCVPTMGYHYAKASDYPFGPIYGYYGGKAIFTEFMPTVKQFADGFNVDEIKPLPGYKIDHIDIWFEKNGHPGLPVPHYDIHAWYVPHSEHMTFCNNPSGTRPPWL